MRFPTFPRSWPQTVSWLAVLLIAMASVGTLRAQEAAGVATNVANVATESVMLKATPEIVKALLDKPEYELKPTGKDGYVIKLDGLKVAVFIPADGSLMLHVGFSGIKADAMKMNEWNQKHRYSRAFLDNEGDPSLEADLDFDGGVTVSSLKKFIGVFRTSTAAYRKFLKP